MARTSTARKAIVATREDWARKCSVPLSSPTNASPLAPVVVKRFRDAVLKIEDLGISLLIAESNLVNAARIADRLYAIDRGEIIFEGKPQQALEDENVMKALRG
jgi:branched-chain amino acid transport system ATP-binding protein